MCDPMDVPKRRDRRNGRDGRRLLDKVTYYGKAIGLIVAGAVYFGVEAYDRLVASKESKQIQELVNKNKDDHIRILQEQIEAMKKATK